MRRGKQWHRRAAIHLAGQLPEDPADALVVLDLMRDLLVNWLGMGGNAAPLSLVNPPGQRNGKPVGFPKVNPVDREAVDSADQREDGIAR